MKSPSREASRLGHIVCPSCGVGELVVRGSALRRLRGTAPARCDSCGLDVDGAVFKTIAQIVALPGAVGSHACECGHPEMRKMPDGVFHCPACGSEAIPCAAFPGRRPALEGAVRKPGEA